MKRYQIGSTVELTHSKGYKIIGRLGFVDRGVVGIYSYLDRIPVELWTDNSIEMRVGRDRCGNRDIYKLRVPLDDIEGTLDWRQDFIMVA